MKELEDYTRRRDDAKELFDELNAENLKEIAEERQVKLAESSAQSKKLTN